MFGDSVAETGDNTALSVALTPNAEAWTYTHVKAGGQRHILSTKGLRLPLLGPSMTPPAKKTEAYGVGPAMCGYLVIGETTKRRIPDREVFLVAFAFWCSRKVCTGV